MDRATALYFPFIKLCDASYCHGGQIRAVAGHWILPVDASSGTGCFRFTFRRTSANSDERFVGHWLLPVNASSDTGYFRSTCRRTSANSGERFVGHWLLPVNASSDIGYFWLTCRRTSAISGNFTDAAHHYGTVCFRSRHL